MAEKLVHAIGVTILAFFGVAIYAGIGAGVVMLALGVVHGSVAAVPAFGFLECVVITAALRLFAGSPAGASSRSAKGTDA